ncbi:prolipoprotein diacylglyceryl transferase [Murdochiella vaginalis]|uniref:prolipoprotein diacylglyceryl transferase n=1 Tax=Murdochiella vaginalis TaxID=1852373 RepID=UPI0008FE046D|nr:prolipoprotein diacylglyceryl transferase [Murdochiella vaginalis]
MFEYTGNGVAITLFGLEVRWYGVLIVTGMLLAVLLSSREVKRKGMPEDIVYDLSLWVLPLGVIGARLWYVLFEPQRFSSLWDVINLRSGGLAIQGGVMVGLLVSWIYLHRRNISFLRVADCIIPFLPLAQAIGRWGNFFNNEAYGYAANIPWAVLIDGKPHHPTFFYESAGDFLLFLFLWYFLRKRTKVDGQTTSLYFVFYGILRFIVEGFRTDSLYFGALRVAQLLAIGGMLLGLLGYVVLSKKGEKSLNADKGKHPER